MIRKILNYFLRVAHATADSRNHARPNADALTFRLLLWTCCGIIDVLLLAVICWWFFN
jgi:hypothetical protein